MKTYKKRKHALVAFLLVMIMCLSPLDVMAFNLDVSLYPPEESADAYYDAVTSDYLFHSIPALLKDEKVEIAGNGITTEDDTKNNGVMISGKQAAISSTVISFKDAFDFGTNQVGRVQIDALAQKRCNIHADIYLDEATEPIASLPLKKSKKDNNWTYESTTTADVLDQHITGTHTVKVALVSDTDSKQSVLVRGIEFVQSSIPVIYLNIDESEGTINEMNNDTNHAAECFGDMTVQVPDGYIGEYGDTQKTQTYEMEYIRGRGNSTWMMDKKPYKIKLSKKADLFGMGKNKHWVLLANRFDNSLLRNKMTYWLGDAIGMEFTPKCVFVDVVMNGNYLGSYYLSEQVRLGENRVDIDDLAANDETKAATDLPEISGGYLLSMEPYGDEDNLSFTTSHYNSFLIESPDFDGYTNDAQYEYISNYMQDVEDAVYGKDFKNDKGQSYKDLMDLQAAADYWWIQEISTNGDAFVSTSTYLYKKRDGKLYWGPLWDFDYVAWMSYNMQCNEDESWENFHMTDAPWFDRMLHDKEFVAMLTKRWPVIRDKLTEITKDGGLLDQYYEQLKVSQCYDMEKWGACDFEQETPLTYKQEVDRLKGWIKLRSTWINDNLSTLIPKEYVVQFKVDGKVVATKTVISGDTISDIPTAPAPKKGYTFVGWSGKDELGEEVIVTKNTPIYDDLILTPKYIKNSSIIHAKNIYTEHKDYYLDVWDDYININYTITPFDALEDTVTWESSDPSIATVEDNFDSVFVTALKTGTVTITGTLDNGVKTSVKVHIVDSDEDDNDIWYPYEFKLNKESLTMKPNEYQKLTPKYEEPCYTPFINWISTNQTVATITSAGVVHAESPGETIIAAYDANSEVLKICKVKVTGSSVKKGNTYTVDGKKYKVTSTTSKKRTVTFTGMASKKKLTSTTIPATVKLKGKTYKVTAIGAKALKGQSKLKKITIKSSYLTSVGKEAIKGISKKTVIKVPSKKLKKYKKLFTKKTGFTSSMKIKK